MFVPYGITRGYVFALEREREWEYICMVHEVKDGIVRKGSTVFFLLSYDFRPATAAVSRLRGCRGDARRPRDDVLHRARRNSLT